MPPVLLQGTAGVLRCNEKLRYLSNCIQAAAPCRVQRLFCVICGSATPSASLRSAGEVFACLKRAGTLRWARGREGCSDSPLPTSGLHPPRNSNDDDRRQRRKQGGVVGAAASKTRVPPKARSGCWEPQPVSKGYTPLTILKKKSKHKKASAAPVGASALPLFSLLHL